MAFKEGNIDGVQVKTLTVHEDDRGTLIQTFRLDSLPEGLHPVMSYVSYTKLGVSRGPHEHREQTDIFSFIGPGTFELYLYDNREESKTYLNKKIITVGKDNPMLIIIPPGVVHGYRNISENEQGMVVNYPDRLYHGWGGAEEIDEIRHEDTGSDFLKDFIK
ncbi:MAG: dTDP-4-dehydrorhamnose 3,5-epimerase family protein [Spirochaetota bacterium]|nr:MAG: dTDP-4-dehydrorhamnose 3,5-epimerase family protein [Spirochaetota bacterium]